MGGCGLMAENPKTAAGRLKPESHVVSPIALAWLTAALENGAIKYGPFNWREEPIPANTYVSAIRRHLDLYAAGDDVAPDSKVLHLAHIMASCAILIDAAHAGSLIDDRHKVAGLDEIMQAVAELKRGWLEAKEAATVTGS